jgi:hypothetical protein
MDKCEHPEYYPRRTRMKLDPPENHCSTSLILEGWTALLVIGKVLADNRSSAHILFMKTFKKMSLSQHMLQPPEYPLLGFMGN